MGISLQFYFFFLVRMCINLNHIGVDGAESYVDNAKLCWMM